MSFLLVLINLFMWFRLRSSSHYEEWINRQVIFTATSNTGLFHLKIASKRSCLTSRCEETIKAFLTVATVIANISFLFQDWLQTLCLCVPSLKMMLRWTRAQWAPSSTTPMPGTGGTRSYRSEWFLQRSTTRAFLSCMVLHSRTISNPKRKMTFWKTFYC